MKGVGIIPRNNPAIIRSMLLFKNWICNGTVMFKRKIIFNNNIWYKDGNLGMQDFRFFTEASKIAKFSSVSDVLLYYRVHSKNTTQYMQTQKVEQRAVAYADIQRKSIEASGFELTKKEMEHINYMITEKMHDVYTIEEIRTLYAIFKKMLIQAENIEDISSPELRWVCKKILADRLIRTDYI